MKFDQLPEVQAIADGMLDSIDGMSENMPAGCEMRVVIAHRRCSVEYWLHGTRIVQKERSAGSSTSTNRVIPT